MKPWEPVKELEYAAFDNNSGRMHENNENQGEYHEVLIGFDLDDCYGHSVAQVITGEGREVDEELAGMIVDALKYVSAPAEAIPVSEELGSGSIGAFTVDEITVQRETLTGIDLISSERIRQVEEEGWTQEHDDKHSQFDLPKAAIAYVASIYAPLHNTPPIWPWSDKYWKPTPENHVRQLTKAGALIAAEIDRLVRRDGFDCCPFCCSKIIYRDRCDAERDVAHCDDCGNEIPGDVYRQILENEKHGNGEMLASFFSNPGIDGSLGKTTSGD